MLAHPHQVHLVAQALAADPLFSGVAGKVYRQRRRPLPTGMQQACAVRINASRPLAVVIGGAAPVDWATRIALEYTARVVAGQPVDEAGTVLVAAGHARIAAAFASNPDGFALHPPAPDLVWDDDDEADETVCAVTALYTFRHRTDINNLHAVT